MTIVSGNVSVTRADADGRVGNLRESRTRAFGGATIRMSILSPLRHRLRTDPQGTFCERRGADGKLQAVTIAELADDVSAAARGLVVRGIQPRDRVAIMGRTRYEWTVADLASLAVGAVVVPIYQTSSAQQVRWICEDAKVRLVVAETREMGELVRGAVAGTGVRGVVVIDEGGLEELKARGVAISPAEVLRRTEALDGRSIATIVYTSGTTGRPKGVVLTHGNFLIHAANGADDPNLGEVVNGPEHRILLFLPLAHVFGRFLEVLCLYSRCVLFYTPSARTLIADAKLFRPTWIMAVPRVFEKIYDAAVVASGSGPRRAVFDWAERQAIGYSKALDEPGGPTAAQRARLRLAKRLVLNRIAAVLGGHVHYAVSGGAPLSTRLGHFFRGLGLTVMEGYGLTELSAPTSVNRPGLIKIGSVGAPYPGTAVRIGADGEIEVRGPNLFQGYWRDGRLQPPALDDGWFPTGDLGRLDSDGYLYVTGRKKEILVTAGGKNVQPEVLENVIRRHPLVSEVVVIGDRRPFVSALISLDAPALARWFDAHKVAPVPPAEAGQLPGIRAELDAAVAEANAQVSRAESVRKYVVVERDFSAERGEVSASEKVRRSVVLDHFAGEVAQIYAGKVSHLA